MEGYDSDKEQVEAIKKWWNENGTWLVLGLAIGLSGLFGFRYYESYQLTRAQNASVNFENFISLIEKRDRELARSTGASLIAEYPGSPYAALTSLHLARLALDAGELEAAEANLDWVIANADVAEVRDLAELRRLRLLVDQGRAEEAAKAVPKLLKGDDLLRLELAGDIQAQLGDLDGAVAAYDRILSLPTLDPTDRSVIELKLDAVGTLGD